MKKNRPAHLLSVLCEPARRDRLASMIFKSGKTLGIRVGLSERVKLPRRETTISTSGGDVSVKLADFDGSTILFPEYDDMVHAMNQANRSYDDIYFEIQCALRKES